MDLAALGASPEAQQIHALVAAMKNRPPAPDPTEALIAAARAQAAQNVPPFPELDSPEFAAMQAQMTAPPQSALTADREMRFAGMPPPAEGHMSSIGQFMPGPQQTPEQAMQEQMQNELSGAIPMLQEQGLRIRQDQPPAGTPGIGLLSGGFAELPSQSMGRRSIHDLRAMDMGNQAQQPEGIMGMLEQALFGKQSAPNPLSDQEQLRVDTFNKASSDREAQQAQRQQHVTQRAQMKEMGRDMRQQGPQAMELAMLEQAMGQGGEGGPNPMLARLDPRTFALLQEAATGQRAQQRLDQEGQRMASRDTESDRRFDAAREDESYRFRTGEANADRRHQAELNAKDPMAIFNAALTNPAAASAAGLTEEQQIAMAVESVTTPASPVPALLDRKLSLLYPESASDWWGGEKEFLDAAAKLGIPDRIAKPYWDKRRSAELSGTPIPQAGGVTPSPERQLSRGPKDKLPSAAQFGAYSAF